MKKITPRIGWLLPILLGWNTSVGLAEDIAQEGKIEAFLGEPKFEMVQVFEKERFPNVVVTTKGTVVASFGSSRVIVRRSDDAGRTWGDPLTIADPGFQSGGLTVDEVTGDLLAFVEAHHPPARLDVYRSTDDGRQWVKEEITLHPDGEGHLPAMHMNERGITLRHGEHKGRLIRPSRYYGKANAREEWPNHYTNAIYSDDRGKTWHTSAPFPEKGTGEACIVELSDGRLYYNSRVHWQERPVNTRRRSAWSRDGGATWQDWAIEGALPDGPQDTNYGCMGGLVRLPIAGRDILVYSNCDSQSGRKQGTIWASFDGGKSWPMKKRVFDGAFAYSAMTAGRPGTASEGHLFLHFEGGPKGGGTVARFNLAWALEDAVGTGDGTPPADVKVAP